MIAPLCHIRHHDPSVTFYGVCFVGSSSKRVADWWGDKPYGKDPPQPNNIWFILRLAYRHLIVRHFKVTYYCMTADLWKTNSEQISSEWKDRMKQQSAVSTVCMKKIFKIYPKCSAWMPCSLNIRDSLQTLYTCIFKRNSVCCIPIGGFHFLKHIKKHCGQAR